MELFTINNLWMMIATFLVFVMHLGFATLEAGLTQSKNTVNILFKNVLIINIGLLTYTLIGFSLMYPGKEFAGALIGFAGFGLTLPEGGTTPNYNAGYTYWTDFLFQAMFAATAATIVSGAVAERVKLESFLIFSVIYVGICYPIVGMWKWGGGFLEKLGFYDFAGSTIVHSVGGWGAVAGILLLGARHGKYVNGRVNPIPGHNMPLAVIGVFLLWLGWFGFNGGSVLTADAGEVSLVFVTTSLAASGGAIGAFMTSYFATRKHDLSMSLNGILGGLVAITAGAPLMSVEESIIIGFVGGVLVVLAVIFFDQLRMDDPVGVLAVHLVNGIWGTLAVGIFGSKGIIRGTDGLSQLWAQVIGIGVVAIFSFVFAFVLFYLLKISIGIRVDEEIELEGLDKHEHGMSAYPDFLEFN